MGAGRVTRYEELYANQALNVQKDRAWNKDNQLTQEVENTYSADGKKASLATTSYTLMPDGTLSATNATINKYDPTPGLPNNGLSITILNTVYAYEWWDSAKQTGITVGPLSTDVTTPWAPGYSAFSYDVNGHLKTATDRNLTTPRSFSYWTDAEGQVLQRQELIGGTVNAQTGAVNLTGAAKSRDHRYFYFDGKRVGNVGNDGTEREDYAQQLASSANAFESPDNKYRKFTPTNSADFDENYQPINAGFPGPAPGSYTVRPGDTLEGIARALWGDATLWYLLAEANGLDGQPSAPLVANTVLAVPNRVTNVHNTSDTFRPYDAGKAMGDTSPTLPDAPPPPQPRGGGGGCGGFGKIITIVVAVVATVFTAGVATIGLSASLGSIMTAGAGVMTGGLVGGAAVAGLSTGTLFATGALAGGVGSIVSQGVGIAIGAQDSFSWKGVALGALQAGIGAGVGGLLGRAGGLMPGMGAEATMGRMAIGSAIGRGIGVATGLQQKFDWKGVVASAAAGYVSASVAQQLPRSLDGFSRSLAAGMAGGVVSAAVRGGSLNRALSGIVTDVIGSTVGNALGDSLAAANGQGSGGSNSLDAFLALNDNFSGTNAGSTAALGYIANNPGGGMSEADYWNSAAPRDQQYVDTYGGEATPVAWAADGRSDHDLAVDRALALANRPESVGGYVSGGPFRVEVAGAGWVRSETLPDGTPVLKSTDSSDSRLLVEQRSGSGVAPQVSGYEVSGTKAYRGVDGTDTLYSQATAAQDATDAYAGNMDPRDIRGTFGYQSLLSRGLADAEAARALDARIAGGPSMRGWNPATDGVKVAKDRALLSFLNGQGSMALGGVAASTTMLASGNIMAASMATDIAGPIDSLIAPRGGTASQLARVRGSRPIDLAKTYEADVRALYGEVPFEQRTYTALVNDQRVRGVADNVTVVDGMRTAIEAKYVDDWAVSL